MPETVGSHQVAAFVNPNNGETLDATIVRGNDNTLRAGYVSHDADSGVHVQSSLMAARPAAGTAGRKWLTTDTGAVRLWYDTGSAWEEVAYRPDDDPFTVGELVVEDNASVGADLDVVGTVTAATFVGAVSVPASSVTTGTFGAGNYTFPAALTVTTTLTSGAVVANNGQIRAPRATQTGAGGTVSFASANHIRHTMTGNGTLTLSGGVAGGVYTVEVLQDGTGGRTVAWSGVTWPNGLAPTSTTTANRKDVFTFFFDGTTYLGQQFGANYASTA